MGINLPFKWSDKKNYRCLLKDNLNSGRAKSILLIFLLAACNSGLAGQTKTRKAVFVIVDGIPADLISTLHLPYFDSISKTGGFARSTAGGVTGSYTETPTISAVGYNTVLTGTWVNKHNVWDNDIKDPNYNYFSIFRFLKMYSPEKKIGIFSSWEDNRTKLVGEGLVSTGSIKFDFAFDGLEHDKTNFPHDESRYFMHRIDERVTDSAVSAIRNSGPDLSWVYLEYTDDMGHMYGDGPEYYTAIEYADNQVGRIWNAIRYREEYHNEEWLLIVTTDHGRDAKTGKNHGGQTEREKSGWILTNARDLNLYFRMGNSSMADIMPTLSRFMGIRIPPASAAEIDGIPITGKLSFTSVTVEKSGEKAILKWQPAEKSGTMNISMATTNSFKTGAADKYYKMKTVALTDGKTEVDLRKYPSEFYKFLLEAEHNRMNIWIPDSKQESRQR